MFKMDANYKYVRCVEPDTFRPMLRVENIISDEKWMVSPEDIIDQQAFLGERFSIVEFLEKFGNKISKKQF